MAKSHEVTLDDEIAEIKRELGMRRTAYPRWSSGPSARMTKEQATRYILVLESTLKRLEREKAKMAAVQTKLF